MSVDWTIRAGDDPGVLRVLVGSALDEPADTGWKQHATDRPAPGPEIVRTGRPIFIETREEPSLDSRSFGRSNEEPHGTAGSQASRWRWGQRSSEHSASDSIATTWFRRRNGVSSSRSPTRPRSRWTASGRATTSDTLGRPPSTHRIGLKFQAVSDAANAASGLDELVERVLPVVRDAVLADGTSFLLLSDDGRELRLKGRARRRKRAKSSRSPWVPARPAASRRSAAHSSSAR